MSLEGAKFIIEEAARRGAASLLETEAKAVLKALSISVPSSVFQESASISEARLLSGALSYPLAAKIMSPGLLHKSEAGAVRTNIKDASELTFVLSDMIGKFKIRNKARKVSGILIEEMAPPGVEVIVGALRDAQFGPAVLFGTGGVMVEVMGDVSFALAPVDMKEARRMMEDTKGFKLLTGFRAVAPVELGAIEEVIVKISELINEVEVLEEFEINPLIVNHAGAVAVDARAVIKDRDAEH